MNRSRPKQIVIRASEKEFNAIKKKVNKSNLSQNEFLLRAILGKEIVVVEGLGELNVQLARIGNNLNQLTRLAHQGRANCGAELEKINEELAEVWQLLRLLTQRQA